MEWFSTHPMSAARADRLKAELAALPKNPPEPFEFDWKQVQASLGSSRSFPMSQHGTIQIGVIADTHGLFDPAIRRHFRNVDHILHAGDIGDRSVIEELRQIAPVTAVSGNVDDEQSGFPSEAVIELAGRRIAIRHILYEGGKLTKDGRAFLDREHPDICIFGHTHQPKREWFGKVLLFNPGSAGPKRFKLSRGVGILVLARQGITPKHILLDDRRANAMPREAKKSYLGCASGGLSDLSVKTRPKLRTLQQPDVGPQQFRRGEG